MSIFEALNNKLQTATIDELRQMIASAGMSPDVQWAARNELEILSGFSSTDTEEYKNRSTYVRYLLSLPWNRNTEANRDMQRLERILDEGYPGPRSVKEKILKHFTEKIHKAKLLVVDDEKIALNSLVRALSKEGYSVVPASNGTEAIEKLRESDFDVVITDLIMGDIDGHAVLEETKSRHPDTRLIMITGYATVDTAVQALRTGAFHYIEKPLKLDEVRTAVRDALGNKVSTGKETILCFAGPSESDRISLGQTVAEVLGRKFSRVSLAGIKDESDIRGQNRWISGAMPGCIVEGVRRAGVSDPVVILDGLESMVADFKDNFISILIEVIDPERNKGFIDYYLDVPFDLSQVIFILSTNYQDSIPPPLTEFLEIIEFQGLT
jgi:ATP-dependent Lon protease